MSTTSFSLTACYWTASILASKLAPWQRLAQRLVQKPFQGNRRGEDTKQIYRRYVWWEYSLFTFTENDSKHSTWTSEENSEKALVKRRLLTLRYKEPRRNTVNVNAGEAGNQPDKAILFNPKQMLFFFFFLMHLTCFLLSFCSHRIEPGFSTYY